MATLKMDIKHENAYQLSIAIFSSAFELFRTNNRSVINVRMQLRPKSDICTYCCAWYPMTAGAYCKT
eukprot:6214489-Pleurochrysis_carterae.AAC.2